ncbi:MAG: amidohydrolase/deacetylase family metallohydrolase [Chloroflexi bacterium]|nr:amidohydrolase/deacetylase family metallohydrolase [Chloroflexota bacterium]
MATYDLVVRGGTLIDPAQGIHAPRDVAFRDGVVAAVDESLPVTEAARVVDASGRVVTPGMIDLHVHVFEGVSHLGIAPDSTCLARGATTVVDAGSAGADTFPGFRKYVIETSATRIFAQLNISSQGMLSPVVGELDDLKWASIPRALEVIEKHRDLILGVKVRLTRRSIVGESAGLTPLYYAREAADAAGLPIMVHPQSAWCPSLDDIVAVMRAGDILTHTYHGMDHGILDERGGIRRSVREARERGVIFDVGHGAGSFNWQVCETALAQGFPPMTVSSDLHVHSVNGPVFDLATTVSKFLHLGLSLDEALAKVTAVPAEVIGMANRIGTLAVGAWGDAVVFDLQEGAFELVDSQKQPRVARRRLVPRVVIKGGRVYSGSPEPA